jgi:transposase
VSKSELEARPVYVSREDRINAHFLTCFVAMVIIRLIQYKLDFTIPAGKILASLAKACCSNIQDNIYMYDYFDDVLARVGSCFGIDFAQKFRTQANIKNISSNVKKR